MTFSMHGENNFPLHKSKSTLDVPLKDHMGDEEYLDILRHHLPKIYEQASPDIVFYAAGVDVVQGDRLGRLKMTEEGLRQREHYAVNYLHVEKKVPLVLLTTGGYASSPERTAELHAIVFREALQAEQSLT